MDAEVFETEDESKTGHIECTTTIRKTERLLTERQKMLVKIMRLLSMKESRLVQSKQMLMVS